MSDLIEQSLKGHRRSMARLMTQVESNERDAREIVRRLYPFGGKSHIVGITGPPGVGKSSLVTVLAQHLRRQGKTVGIVAVDPSSPFSGGALLGDRVRMRVLAGDRGVFVRSMASRGQLGGIAQATMATVLILDAAGFDIILVETVGAGQAEVDIAHAAQTTVVVEAPGLGDDVQASKAGILEIADILVVNKADRPGAANSVKALRMMLQLGMSLPTRHHGRWLTAATAKDEPAVGWSVPVLETVSIDGTGVDALAEQIAAHRAYIQTAALRLPREMVRSERVVMQLLQARLVAQLRQQVPEAVQVALITAVAER